jgi:hypothetical protein
MQVWWTAWYVITDNWYYRYVQRQTNGVRVYFGHDVIHEVLFSYLFIPFHHM